MFHFPGCPPMRLWIHLMVTGHYPGRVPPFGYPWINAYLRLPMAFRSLSRPSSAISALASTLRSYSLDLASSNGPFLRLLRWPVEPLIVCFSSSATSVSDWMPPLRSLLSECLPCAVFKVRARLPPRPCGAGRSYAGRSPAEPATASRMLRILPHGLCPLPLAAALSHSTSW